ncbi:MAG: 16S rRNA (cytosine(967)-C(5))-methyltransferase RsmB [Methylococcales bacterium]|nr:16S rRNA (cytosine(967)-C(5))-methyltransferase RsmB [Methylococcales bacterium]
MSIRALAAAVLTRVLADGASLTAALAALPDTLPSQQQAWIKAACYGVLRDYPRLHFYLTRLLDKPVKAPQVESFLLLGLYQLTAMQVKTHAAVSETVAALPVKQRWAKGLVNGVLRTFLRQRISLEQAAEANREARFAHPAWIIDVLYQDWPRQAESILAANNQQAPMTLRVNLRQTRLSDYQARLQALGWEAWPLPGLPAALTLAQAVPVGQLPGFAEGWVSVQDGAAQWAAGLMALQPGLRVLDACAAPGGKTAHMLELCPDIELLALDIAEARLARIADNLTRLHGSAQLCCADAAQPETWWDGRAFERILLDAPCSGSGVIRRHPDIKLHRRPDDIATLVASQQAMLTALWPTLAPGGLLVYATCSVFKAENEAQIAAFLAVCADAEIDLPPCPFAQARPFGQQVMAGCGDVDVDGFYYARLRKR